MNLQDMIDRFKEEKECSAFEQDYDDKLVKEHKFGFKKRVMASKKIRETGKANHKEVKNQPKFE